MSNKGLLAFCHTETSDMACRHIHILNVAAGYSKAGRLTGHSSTVRSIDWSQDASVLMAMDQAYETLFFDTRRGTTSKDCQRDQRWATWTNVLGFPVMGIWPEGADGTDINAVDRSPDGTMLLTCDDKGKACSYVPFAVVATPACRVTCPCTVPSRYVYNASSQREKLIDNGMNSTLIATRRLHCAGESVCKPVCRCQSTALLPLWSCIARHLCALVRMWDCRHFCWRQGSGCLPLAHHRCLASSAATSCCAPLGARSRRGGRPILEGLHP
jgi:WD40 repeat protein